MRTHYRLSDYLESLPLLKVKCFTTPSLLGRGGLWHDEKFNQFNSIQSTQNRQQQVVGSNESGEKSSAHSSPKANARSSLISSSSSSAAAAPVYYNFFRWLRLNFGDDAELFRHPSSSMLTNARVSLCGGDSAQSLNNNNSNNLSEVLLRSSDSESSASVEFGDCDCALAN